MDVHWVEYYQNMKTNGVDQSDETKSEDNDDMTGGEKSKKSDYDVIRMFTDMRNEVGMRSEQDYLNFKFIYYTSLKDKSALTAIAREGPSALN
ncbi:hypothetical protein PC113_g1523 [Phytophthora cactorum]|uniref:Uncharacterized protein n=1 Tax=Phytophthora cactorum TaxID=29920 RepID=A0A8T1DQT2_9STRA|nr:hypothetical protein PC113_g1523 [Phytophthora cactorum]KAG2941292.1 hypothetical protein PC115_g2057 [Phytophthora cactorum]